MRHQNAERYGFKVISSHLEHTNPYYSIRKYEVITPKGTNNDYWVIEQDPFPVIIPLFPDKTTLLVGQYRVQADLYSWEFPMGAAHGNEVLNTAKAELMEETGFIANDWKQIGVHFIGPGRANLKAVTFIAENLAGGESAPDEIEFLEVKRLPIDKIGRMIDDGTIIDGPTIVSFHHLERYLQKL